MSTHYNSSVHAHLRGSVNDEIKELKREQREIKDLLAKLVLQNEHASSKHKSHHSSKHISHHSPKHSSHHSSRSSSKHSEPMSDNQPSHHSTHHNLDYYQKPPKSTRHRNELVTQNNSKVDLPPFHGRDNIEEYLDWEMKVEQIFACHGVEQQLKRKTTTRKEPSTFKKNFPPKSYPSKPSTSKENTSHTHPPTKTSEIKCFKCLGRGHIASQCPTKKTMILRGMDEYSSQSEESNESDEEVNSEEETLPCEGDLLLVRRLLSTQSSITNQSQRENLFHTRCKVLDKTCSLIIDSGSCSNVCSARLVEKLNLPTNPHPKPYRLQWINEKEELVVDQQVSVELAIGNYKDTILCDIVPMVASHILLGRPWQYDKKTLHDGHTNKITLTHMDRKFVLHPLTPKQVRDDQQILRQRMRDERKQKKKSL